MAVQDFVMNCLNPHGDGKLRIRNKIISTKSAALPFCRQISLYAWKPNCHYPGFAIKAHEPEKIEKAELFRIHLQAKGGLIMDEIYLLLHKKSLYSSSQGLKSLSKMIAFFIGNFPFPLGFMFKRLFLPTQSCHGNSPSVNCSTLCRDYNNDSHVFY